MSSYINYGKDMSEANNLLLKHFGYGKLPSRYEDFMKIPQWLRKMIAKNIPLVLSDNYEHFMACLPGKKYAAHHVLVRKQLGGFTVAAGFWKWLEFLSHQITHNEVDLVADFQSGKHNGHPRQFNAEYWHHVVDDFDGYLPIRIECVGEGAVFTGVPFPIAEIYGEKPAVWVNEPMYIQIGQLTHVATIAAQFAEVLGDPWRFIEVAFRALQNCEFSDDMLLAMLIGGGIISTSNDLGAFINGAPFKSAGTTGHCFYQQWKKFIDSLRALLGSELGPYCTVLLDIIKHDYGFKDLQQLLGEGYPAPFAERPDSGDTLKLGMHDLTVLQDEGKMINVVFEDGHKPLDVLEAEKKRKQYGLSKERAIHGAGGAFIGPRRALEVANKACLFHDGTPKEPIDTVETMKICLDDTMKQSVPGRVEWFINNDTGVYILGEKGESAPPNYSSQKVLLYDGLTNPGKPFFNPEYTHESLARSLAIQNGVERSSLQRKTLGPDFTRDIGENKTGIAMTKALRQKRSKIREEALKQVR
ncbi:MAG: hypothetical protein US83_C0004G0054 [Candidatus Falkowbacteria bacterium GW2011_GWC2_38_22]|uniref:Nicotinate phosphoribosyltransferase n=1 Tax=Candidatus Falkowbacteria bacterium GW2011_GWE1_38_31 TaxID=1618638 RepID=A0A0G0JSR3_9BACT|nr:MAG: hypothetical protein US73_C0002G0063 [Candidatus Falkowbacteria bacterium GW2011_GWF2_38_1205]KKQ61670.1 MAG: hypothetical protein US83_C0004G0054 [Candidatus Falkowbacteria bacterium GW2011_GWC2_38_22]KKQ63715.1 MAG: hypothetical protein US84_C0004G0063 [Candidatus Falkowbacteria bacterium GW2011_GWF1_38_22]KKQ65869.1 MAG: hypothetical protein US87_C0004G0054 [Candidatus Falkowbacteria bacterium GW2011_GWE2_38_254]KKQ70578.1 MAG: hypothetical protein US91_C0004G0063 [Candidatus Falkowb